MNASDHQDESGRPAVYRIRVKGTIGPAWADYWFAGFTVVTQLNGESVLIGPAADESALLGLLGMIRDLGLSLLSVRRVEENRDE